VDDSLLEVARADAVAAPVAEAEARLVGSPSDELLAEAEAAAAPPPLTSPPAEAELADEAAKAAPDMQIMAKDGTRGFIYARSTCGRRRGALPLLRTPRRRPRSWGETGD
jgi:hypothetical protein